MSQSPQKPAKAAINHPAESLPAPWLQLRRFTAARIALGRSGGSLPSCEVLAFAHDHALARDAVHAPFDEARLAAELRGLSPEVLALTSAAPDRTTYLQRPDLGRRLSDDSAAQLAGISGAAPELVIMISDGLSALAAQRQSVPLLAALLPKLREAGISLGPLCVIRHARVGIMDQVGSLTHAKLGLILLGERPGLGTPDSLGAYLAYAPGSGRTDADRNCVSNIRPEGLPLAAAAETIALLLLAAHARKLSGVGLKIETHPAKPELA